MAVGKKVSRSAALYGEGQGSAPHIEMPPLGYQVGEENTKTEVNQANIASEAPSSMQASTMQAFKVPDELPEEVAQEMEAQDNNESQIDSVEEPSVISAPAIEKSQHHSKDFNFKELRLAKEKAEKERDALMAQMLEMYQNKQPSIQPKVVAPIEEDIDFNIDEDALVEGKYVKKVVNEIKNLKSQLKNYQSQTQEVAVESKIKATFPDFEKVVSKENVELLNYQYPEIAQSLRDTQDLYSKAASAYKIMKTFGIYKDVLEDDRMKAIKNSQKPRPLASVSPQQGDSPLSKANAFANGMTEELKEQLRKEMYMARKNM